MAFHPTEPLLAAGSYFAPLVQVRDWRHRPGGRFPATPVRIGWRGLASGRRNVGCLLRPRDPTLRPPTGQPYRTFESGEPGGTLAFNPTGDRLARLPWAGTTQLFDVGTGRLLFQSNTMQHFPGASRRVTAGSLRDFRRASSGFGKSGRAGSCASWNEASYLASHGAMHRSAPMASSWRWAGLMACGSSSWTVVVNWPAFPLSAAYGQHSSRETARCSPYRKRAWCAGPFASERRARGLSARPQRLLPVRGSVIDQSQDGGVTVVGCRATGLQEEYSGGWILHRNRPADPIRIDAGCDLWQVVVSPDGRWVVTAAGSLVKLWEAQSGKFVRQIQREAGVLHFSPDGKWLAGADAGYLLAAETWERGPRIGSCGSFAPSGELMAIYTGIGIALVESKTGRELARLDDPYGDASSVVCFTPDGRGLLTRASGAVPGLRLWDLALLREELGEIGLDWGGAPGLPLPATPRRRKSASASVELGDQPLLRKELDPRLAITIYSVALAFQPLSADAYFRRGLARADLFEPRLACADFSMFLALAPSNHARRAEALFRRSNHYLTLGDQKARRADLLELARLDLSSARWISRLPYVLHREAEKVLAEPAEERELENALLLAQKAAELQPNDPAVRHTLGSGYFRLQRHHDVLKVLEPEVIDGAPHTGADLYMLAVSYHHAEQRTKSRYCYERATSWQAKNERFLTERERSELRALRVMAEGLITASAAADRQASETGTPRY